MGSELRGRQSKAEGLTVLSAEDIVSLAKKIDLLENLVEGMEIEVITLVKDIKSWELKMSNINKHLHMRINKVLGPPKEMELLENEIETLGMELFMKKTISHTLTMVA